MITYHDVDIRYSTTGIFYNSSVHKHFNEISRGDLEKELFNLHNLGYFIVSMTCGRIDCNEG